jgi:DNA-binding HxlR family transcriptional regulator
LLRLPAQEKRWYNDACGTALGLELLGERWSLLIVRELMFGGRRFSDLRGSLSGISANILTMRLEGLERAGVVQRRLLPPPASIQIYELTPWGYEAEVILRELGRWATRSPLHDPTLPLSAASLLMSFRTMYSSERAKGEAATIGFGFGADGSQWCSPPARRAARLRANSRGRPDDARLARLCRPSRRRGKRRAQADRRPETFRSVHHLVSTARNDRMIRCRRSGSDRCKPWTDASLERM